MTRAARVYLSIQANLTWKNIPLTNIIKAHDTSEDQTREQFREMAAISTSQTWELQHFAGFFFF